MKKTLAVIGFVSLLALTHNASASYEDGMGNTVNDGMTVTDANNPPELPPADAQMDANAPQEDPAPEAQFIAPTTQHVTSLQKCLDLLEPEDAAEVRLNPEHPYQECHARLADKAARKRTLRISKEKHGEEDTAESPRNFKRVQGSDTPSETAGAKQNNKSIGEAMTSDSGYWSASPKAAQPPSREERAPASLMPDDEDETIHKKGTSRLSWLPDFTTIKPNNSKGSYNN